jgi:putative heme transporter
MTGKVSIKHTLQAAGSMTLLCASAAIVYVLPKLIGSTWTDIIARIATIGLGTVMSIVGLWILGLIVYTIAMTSSMPGLSHRRAMALNLAGSSASNLLPFGGVVGAGLNAAMVRSWRLSVRQFVSSTAVLNLVNLVTKLLLPVIAGIALGSQRAASPWLVHTAYVSSAVAAVVVLALIAALISHAWAVRMDALVRTLGRRLGRRGARFAGESADGSGPVSSMQAQVRLTFRRRWVGLTAGMAGYVLLQWALFALCLHAVGVGANPAAVFAAFAVERALTLAVVTPAGTGIAEAATTGLLVALGFDPAASAAGVVLYRLFVYLAEIPVGAVVVGAWASRRLVRASRAASAEKESAARDSAALDSTSLDSTLGSTALDSVALDSTGVDSPGARSEPTVDDSLPSGPGGSTVRQPDSGPAVTTSPAPRTINPPTASRR